MKLLYYLYIQHSDIIIPGLDMHMHWMQMIVLQMYTIYDLVSEIFQGVIMLFVSYSNQYIDIFYLWIDFKSTVYLIHSYILNLKRLCGHDYFQDSINFPEISALYRNVRKYSNGNPL